MPLLLAVLTVSAVLSAVVGVWLTGTPLVSRRLVPFSGGVLIGMSVFWLLPELAAHFGWLAGPAWLGAGFLLLIAVDRYLYPVCPSCSHTHDHGACATRLHGFALPLMIAASLHSAMDGAGVAVSQREGGAALGVPVLLAIALHKVPEGLALGVIFRASLANRLTALLCCAAVEAPTLLGSAVADMLEPLGKSGEAGFLTLTGGSFLFLGFHAIHGEWKRRGRVAFMPALTGIAGAAVLHLVHAGHG